jgi:16S rRNA (guanine527-N7)-methyltransferase
VNRELWEEGFSFLESNGVSFSAEGRRVLEGQCERFLSILLKKNEVLNLTAIRSPEDAFWKHLIDSFLLLSFEPMAGILDWGTGGGIPGIPYLLAKNARGEKGSVVFLDSVGKKVRAVEEFLEALDLVGSARCVHSRGEDFLVKGNLQGIDTVVMRAVAPTERAKKWISLPAPLERWILFLGPQQLDLWRAEEKFLKKRGFGFGRRQTFQLPAEIGQRVLLELKKN